MSPFDAARYARLLKGLEAIERPASDVFSRERMDSEAFAKAALELSARLAKLPRVDAVSQVAAVSDGNHLSIANEFGEAEGGVRYLRGQDINGAMMLDDRNPVFIPESEYDKLARSHIFRDDVLITIVGANTGQTALVDAAPEKLTANCKLGILRAKRGVIAPAYLHAFLAGRYGQSQVLSAKRGGGQMGLILPDLKALAIARFSEKFEARVAYVSILAHQTNRERQAHFGGVEAVLLTALGLGAWRAPESLSYVRQSSEAFSAARLDAEHFQEKFYSARQALLDAGAKRFVPLPELLIALTNGHTPLRHDLNVGDVPFLCAEHVTDFNMSYESDKRILLEHHHGELARTALRDGDVLFTIKGRVGNAAIAERVPGPVNINQDVGLLRFTDELPLWYIVAYLNCQFGKLQSEKMATGAINPFLGLFSIRQFEVPEFDRGVMEDIARRTQRFVSKTREASQRATQLLDAAKRAVEIAIEDSEAAALAYLDRVAPRVH
ncbi:hypothetical protein ACG04Q_15960 [Roseateles sp. DXS20W]|uniref:Restriction endonuclease subunit S n=1 Tax=Pelomonas lactea TaxID=3299030 RepID=A0ABW7GM89_9BURK